MSIFLCDISFFLPKGFLSQTPSTMHDEAMRRRISEGFNYSVFCIPVFIYNTSLVGTIFPRMHWQHQFPVGTVLLQYFLGICIFFFFYLCVKNTCRGEGNWISTQTTLQSTIFCGKTWFVSQFSGCTQVFESDNKQERKRSFSSYSFEGGLSFIT